MALKDNFCFSPWINTGVDYDGNYLRCRWESTPVATQNITETSPIEFFDSKIMADIRKSLLDGQKLDMCRDCRIMEMYGKVSPRQKQLLKTGITLDQFEKTLLSSPRIGDLDYSNRHDGKTKLLPVDWQIHLSNYCNSACVFCDPQWSSRVEAQYREIGWYTGKTVRWDEKQENITRLVDAIRQSTDTRYIHFIGGETLITPSFKIILRELSELQHAKYITIGFTTNLTVFDDEIVDLLSKFKEIHLGVSIETPTIMNDYVRWPSKIDNVLHILDQWIRIKPDNWLYQLRITPTMLTVSSLHELFAMAERLSLITESCNFLEDPDWLKINVLPIEFRSKAANDLETWINNRESTDAVNLRNERFSESVLIRDAQSYVRYLRDAEDLSYMLPITVQKLKQLEMIRNNSLLDYVNDEYRDLFRSAGY